MALVYCTQCGQPVSEHAAACPHCGVPVRPLAKQATKTTAKLTDNNEVSRPAKHNNTPKHKGRINGLIAALITALVLLLFGGGWYFLHQQEQQRLAKQQAIEQARLDSIAQAKAAEQARRDSIAAAEAAEQARQDSIAKWDFFTASEIISISEIEKVHTYSELRSICRKHGMNILYNKEYKDAVDFNNVELAAGKNCEVTWTKDEYDLKCTELSLKPTSDVAFGVVMSSRSVNHNYIFNVLEGPEGGSIFFAFPTKEARDLVISGIRSKNNYTVEKYEDYSVKYYYRVKEYEENGLYWLTIQYYDRRFYDKRGEILSDY